MINYTTKVKSQLVCECGHVFHEGLSVHCELDELGVKYKHWTCEPYQCPNCNRVITEIECDGKFVTIYENNRSDYNAE